MLTSRQRRILKSIIDIYIKTAEPVGSKMLAGCCDFGLSPATLRYEMAELISQGYLEQPHTSAGRVPTHKGYRLYVNELMNGYALTKNEADELRNALNTRIANYDRIADQISKVLSEVTNYAAITATPRMTADQIIRRLDIVKCDDFVYVILVITDSGTVKNKIVRVFTEPNEDELSALITALNKTLYGHGTNPMTTERVKILEGDAKNNCQDLFTRVIEFLKEISDDANKVEINLEGEGHLLDYPEYRDIDKVKALFEFLNYSESLEWLPMPGDMPLVVRIGEENLARPLKDASLMVASCNIGKGYFGYVGIIGPTRMNYSRLAARLSFFARGLGEVIRDTQYGTQEKNHQEK